MISVCIATYNGEKYIKEQLDSILSQLDYEDEVIISDDGSQDATIEIINAYRDHRIKLFNHKAELDYTNHERVTQNFENALKKSKGDLIFLSDQDDVWESNKVIKCKEFLKEYDFVVHQMNLISNSGKHLLPNSYYKNVLPKLWLKNVIHEKIWGCCICFRREVLNFVMPFPTKLIGHDYWISTISIAKFNCTLLNEKLIKYRVHDDSVSYHKKNTLLYKIRYRIILLFQLMLRMHFNR